MGQVNKVKMSSTTCRHDKGNPWTSPATAAIVGLVFIMLFSCTGCKKEKQTARGEPEFEIDKKYERGPLTAHVRVSKSRISIAETLWLELETETSPGYEVNMPKVDSVLEQFGIVDWRNLGSRFDVNDNIVSTYRYRLEPFLSGSYVIPAFTFEFRDVNESNGKSYELTTEPIDIEVTSLLGEQRGELAIGDIEDVVDMPSKASSWWLAPVAAVVLVAGSVLLYLRRRKAKTIVRIFKPAHEIAYARLQALVRRDLVKAGKVKQFYEAISDILRHYIEDRFELRAPERTTEEFLLEIQNTDTLCEADRKSLMEFLTHCDLVKFAEHSPTAEQIQRTFDLAKGFIEQTKSDERKIDVTDRVETGQPVGAGES